jgi:hypothetical protein
VKKATPAIELDPVRITADELLQAPEKMELAADGTLFGTEADCIWMLQLLLRNVGLRKAVTLAPRERWLEALGRPPER